MTTMANAAAAMQNARTAAPKLYGDMTKDEILERVANYIENNYGGRAFKTLREVEEPRLSELRLKCIDC